MNEEISLTLAELKSKALRGPLAADELRRAIVLMREGRVAAAQTSTKSRASKTPVNSEDLLNQLEGI